jgi:hypothetical protein
MFRPSRSFWRETTPETLVPPVARFANARCRRESRSPTGTCRLLRYHQCTQCGNAETREACNDVCAFQYICDISHYSAHAADIFIKKSCAVRLSRRGRHFCASCQRSTSPHQQPGRDARDRRICSVSAAPVGLQPVGYSPQTMRRRHRDYRNVLSEPAAPCLQVMVVGFRLDGRYLTPDRSCADSDEKKDIACSEPLDECVIGVN